MNKLKTVKMKNISLVFFALILNHFSFAQEDNQPKYKPAYAESITENIKPNKLKFQESVLARELSESGKIILMSTIAALAYGIVNDLITTQICIEYFSSDRTHHGPFTKKYMPWVYNANNKILYALAWAPLATIPHGLVAGILWAIAARSNSDSPLTWRDMVLPTSILMSTLLVSTFVAGIIEYNKNKDNFDIVATMHNWSYGAGTVGAVGMIFYFYFIGKAEKNIVRPIPNGISVNLTPILIND